MITNTHEAYEAKDDEIEEYLQWLNVSDEHIKKYFHELRPIVSAAIDAELPSHWEKVFCKGENTFFYYNMNDNTSTWDNPIDEKYKKIINLRIANLEIGVKQENTVDHDDEEPKNEPITDTTIEAYLKWMHVSDDNIGKYFEQLRSVVSDAIEEELPSNWEKHLCEEEDTIFYVNTDDGNATWENPLDIKYKKIINRTLAELIFNEHIEDINATLNNLHIHSTPTDQDIRNYLEMQKISPDDISKYYTQLKQVVLSALKHPLPDDYRLTSCTDDAYNRITCYVNRDGTFTMDNPNNGKFKKEIDSKLSELTTSSSYWSWPKW